MLSRKNTLNMNPACSASLLMNDTDVRFHLLHTHILKRVLLAVFSASAVSRHEDINTWGHKYMNNIPRTARRVTWWAFDGFIWVKRSSYHIYIGYRNLKGPKGNLSKYKFGLAEYITVYVIQLQQLLQLLLRIITQYAKYVYFKFYKMFTECFWVISVGYLCYY